MSPSFKKDPAFRAGQAIPLGELREACEDYDARCSNGIDYNYWLGDFRSAVGIDLGANRNEFDLTKLHHGDELILLLNRWGTHLPSRNTGHRKALLADLADWWQAATQAPLPGAEARLTDEGLDLLGFGSRYMQLRDIKAAPWQRFSHVAASKTLYFARPHLFVAWDNAIMRRLGYRRGTAEEYVDYLGGARATLVAISADKGRSAHDLDWLPTVVGQGGCTAAETINKFYWVTAHPTRPGHNS